MEHFPKLFVTYLQKYYYQHGLFTFYDDLETLYLKFVDVNRNSIISFLKTYPFSFDIFFQHYDFHHYDFQHYDHMNIKHCMNIHSMYEYILVNILKYIFMKRKFLLLKKQFQIYYDTKCLKTAKIIARDPEKDDIHIEFKYNPHFNTYLQSAFSGVYQKDFENGYYVFPVDLNHTTQEAMIVYSVYRQTFNKKQVFSYLLNDFQKKIYNELYSIGDLFLDTTFQNICSEFFMNYMNKTLYNSKYTCIKRLQLFIQNNANIAQYIWETNFSTEKKRKTLAFSLNICLKNRNGFIRSNTLDELQMYIDHKSCHQKRSKKYFQIYI
jgi:hypothetical protein